MIARSASLSAVSGSARMTGCSDRGKRADEKNTPEQTNIGIMHEVDEAVDGLRVLRARRDEQPEPGEGRARRAAQRERGARSEPRTPHVEDEPARSRGAAAARRGGTAARMSDERDEKVRACASASRAGA